VTHALAALAGARAAGDAGRRSGAGCAGRAACTGRAAVAWRERDG